ncbi:protein kinase [Gemmatimonadota bacterium]
MIGRTIGQYQVIDKIGEGGMGAVYKAEDTTLHRLVALKTLARSLSVDPEAKERFVREAQAASALNHPNITTVFELVQDEEEDSQLICMEYVEGKTIRDMVETGRVSVRKAIDIIMQAAEALEAAHNKGILHRDVKSANIMVSMEGRVKVMDFGLAHLESRSKLTRTGTTMGTLSYSSPEQISGRPVDARSEIFSLGVVFYELLTGNLPFSATNEAELVFSIINNEPERLTQVRDEVPELVEGISKKMLDKDPQLRYQSCGELIGDLRSVRADLETTQLEPTVATEISRRRTRRMIGIPMVLTLAIVGGLIIDARSRFVEGSAIVIPFQDRTRDASFEPLSLGGAEQISQAISGLANGVDIQEYGNQSDRSSSGQPLSTRRMVGMTRKNQADISITASYWLDGDDLVFQPIIHSRSRNDSWSLPQVRGSSSEPSEVLRILTDYVEGMIACIRDDQYRVLAPLIGYPPSLRAFLDYREGLHEIFLGSPFDAVPKIEAVAFEYPDYVRPLLWLARCSTWGLRPLADMDSILTEIERKGLRLDAQEEAFRELLEQDRRNDREACYRAALRLYELTPGTYWNYEAAKWAVFTQRPRQAVELLQSYYPEADVLRNSTNVTRFMLSLAYHKLEMHEEAFRTIDELREIGPDSRSLYYEVLSLGALGRLDDIMIRFEEEKGFGRTGLTPYPIFQPHPGSPGGLLVVGGVRLREYSFREESRVALQKAIEWYESQDPEHYKASIAEAHYWAENWKVAEELYSEVSADEPDNLRVVARLGTIAARLGDLRRASNIFEQLQSLNSQEPELLFFMAGIAAVMGEKDVSVGLVRSALNNGLPWRDDIRLNIDLESLRDYPNFKAIFELKG